MRDNRLVERQSDPIRPPGLIYIAGATVTTLLALSFHAAAGAASALQIPDGFTSLLAGNNLAAWHVSRSSSHGSSPDWHLENETLIGGQRPPGKGGVLLTNRRYGDVEVY